jgi:NADPH-dependent 2,4-dienoyl-CoA reductase/sulfur reductase-like enzyme
MTGVPPTLIVGASISGVRTALQLRRAGHTGPITLLDAQEHPPYDRPPLSKTMLTSEAQPSAVTLLTAERAAELEISLALGLRASGLDLATREVEIGGGSRLAFGELVLATGARPLPLPWPKTDRMFELRTLDDARRLRDALRSARKVAIIGAGFIGAEVAAAARTLGLDVSLIDLLPYPMARALDPETGRVFRELHENHGVHMHLGVRVEAISSDGSGVTIALSDTSVIQADIAMVGIGVTPAIEWLQSSGLHLDNGITCDAHGRAVGQDGIYAVGDAASWYHPRWQEHRRVEHWTTAMEQANAVARYIVDPDGTPEFAPVEYVWSDQYDWKIQLAGDTKRGVRGRRIVEPAPGTRQAALWSDPDGAVCAGFAVNWPKASVAIRRALGEQRPADQLEAELASAMSEMSALGT